MKFASALTVLLTIALAVASRAQTVPPTLCGTVVDAESGKPVAFVTVTLDSLEQRLSSSDGFFDFGAVADGDHILIFDHISYRRYAVTIRWPQDDGPLRVELHPSQFEMEKIVVEGDRVLPSFPVGTVSVSRQQITTIPGNIANDPLRTIQAQPSCASDGVDFLSRLAVRGGDGEEHRVYFDGYPLRHYAHVSGYTGVVYDDMLSGTALIPGAAPMQYNGTLSGVIALAAVKPDTSLRSFRYDITSMAAGISDTLTSRLAVQASAKSSFFNLPVYRDVGVESRKFRDFLGRVIVAPGPAVTVTSTLLWAMDDESGNFFVGEDKRREVNSLLGGVDVSYRPRGWELGVRPYYSYYDGSDALTYPDPGRSHEVSEARVRARAERRGQHFSVGVLGEVGAIRHQGSGGDIDDTPYSAVMEAKLSSGNGISVVLGGGGSKEPWTADVEPEAYGSLRISLGPTTAAAGVRRSHQTPFIFSERRYFASLPVDAGDLLVAYAPSWEEARAVRMDQVSVESTLDLPLGMSLAYNGFWREYDHLLTWNWDDFPLPGDVRSDGDGHGYGYEITLTRDDPDFLSLFLAMSRARVWKREGTLAEEKIGDFDRPASWQVGVSARLSQRVRLSLRWMDVDGRPYTAYSMQSTPPAAGEVNAIRLRRFKRFDAKLVYSILGEEFDGELFLDIINVLNRTNISMRYAVESAPGEFTSVPYGGTRWFPIAGATVRW